jgi:hypothetical protein
MRCRRLYRQHLDKERWGIEECIFQHQVGYAPRYSG